jgi:aconitate hydratase
MGYEENVHASAALVACTIIPLSADGDTGYGNAMNVYFTVRGFDRAGLACLMIEDQVPPKRCGHMAGKQAIFAEEGVEKIRAAVETRRDPDFMIKARTDATAIHGVPEAIRRLNLYAEAGADLLFADALLSADDIATVARNVSKPLSVNMGFGIRQRPTTPLLSARQLEDMGVKAVSYPRMLTAAAIQGMKNALTVLQQSLDQGTVIDRPGLLVTFGDLQRPDGPAPDQGAGGPLRQGPTVSLDSFGTRRTLATGQDYYSLPALARTLGITLNRLPFSLRILLENLLRNEDGHAVTKADIEALAHWPAPAAKDREVAFHPARVLMPDSSGIPLLIDLAAMRDAMAARGLDPKRVNPRIPVDLVIDHSVRVDFAGSPKAFSRNLKQEMERNRERYEVVRWAMAQYDNLRVIPPSNGILHQLNLEYLATVVATTANTAFPDTLVGMDSHTPMINGLGIFGWGVGGIEAATAMLGEPVSLLVPRVVGCRLTGRRRPGVVCTDIVLTVTELLRKHGVLAAIVEYTGPGLDALSLPDRATIANMAAEYGATMGFFPWDVETIKYLQATNRPTQQTALVEAYAKAQHLWRTQDSAPRFEDLVELDLGTVEPCLAGPTRPEDRVPLTAVPASFRAAYKQTAPTPDPAETDRPLANGDIAIAAISSCTNTSNPFQVIAAGLLARNAAARGLRAKPWVKTSISPGSRVVTAMLQRAGLQDALDTVGFHTVGYGCMTCGGGAGPLPDTITTQTTQNDLIVLGVISTNRNFEGRLRPSIRGTYLASPPLVVAYAIAGSVLHDVANGVLAIDSIGTPVRLKDLWPSDQEVQAVMDAALTTDLFQSTYGNLADGGPEWAALLTGNDPTFAWNPASLYLKRPPFLDATAPGIVDITGARPLLILGDNVTTDHISPGGAIPADAPAGQYLIEHGVNPPQFSSYVGRRANHEVMVRGTFANIRLRNAMAPGTEGGLTRHMPIGDQTTIHDAAERYRRDGVPLIVIAGSNYGCGSSRDWAAKGTQLLGIRAVIAESFERIHRSNLIGMGVIPLQFPPNQTAAALALDGSETFDLRSLSNGLTPGMTVTMQIHRIDSTTTTVPLTCRVDTGVEATWLRNGGILPSALRALVAEAAA